MTLSDSRAVRRLSRRRGRYPRPHRGSPDYPDHRPCVPCPTTPADRNGCERRLLPHSTRPSPYLRRVGVRDFTFEAHSGFTRVTARKVAQPPGAAFVTGLQTSPETPAQSACQLPDQTVNCLGGSFLHWSSAPSGRTEISGLMELIAIRLRLPLTKLGGGVEVWNGKPARKRFLCLAASRNTKQGMSNR